MYSTMLWPCLVAASPRKWSKNPQASTIRVIKQDPERQRDVAPRGTLHWGSCCLRNALHLPREGWAAEPRSMFLVKVKACLP